MSLFRNTLGNKLLLLYLLLFIITFSFIHTLGTDYIEKKVIEDSTNMLKKAGTVILSRHIIGQSYTEENIRNFQNHIEFGAGTIGCRIFIINHDGDILIDTENEHPNDNIYRYGTQFLREESTAGLTIGNLVKEPVLCVPFQVENNVLFTGYLTLMTPMKSVESRTNYYFNILDSIFYVIMFCLAFIFIILYFITAIPLRKLINSAKSFSIRRSNPPIHMKLNDEYRDLADTLNVIGEQLSKFDEYQRSFVANISHDFRSPLTSIQGYAVAMKDGTIPVDMQEKYLNIILFETDRLANLTSDLLKLNTFDKNLIILDYSAFDIRGCIRQTAESLDGTASDKNVTIELNFPEDSPLMAYADIGKIQQVLHNIIDNAIKFSDSGGKVKISARHKRGKIIVSVKDNGVGIPKEQIPKIWDRFYKTDRSRGRDKKGTGLGLCICQEIILAHNQKIDVLSTEGIGTEFVFSLEKNQTGRGS